MKTDLDAALNEMEFVCPVVSMGDWFDGGEVDGAIRYCSCLTLANGERLRGNVDVDPKTGRVLTSEVAH